MIVFALNSAAHTTHTHIHAHICYSLSLAKRLLATHTYKELIKFNFIFMFALLFLSIKFAEFCFIINLIYNLFFFFLILSIHCHLNSANRTYYYNSFLLNILYVFFELRSFAKYSLAVVVFKNRWLYLF